MEARTGMLMASLMGGMASQKGLGLTSSCGRALSKVTDLNWGLASGIMIDHAMKHHLASNGERMKKLALAAGLSNPTGEGFIYWLHDLKMDIRIPERLSSHGAVRHDQLGTLARLSLEDSGQRNDMRPCTIETFVKVYDDAY